MTLSNGPSMKSCTWLCWSVAPTAASGVGPTCTVRAVAVHPLAQALGPELAIPLGELAQAVGVGHQHVNPRAEVGVGRPVERGVERRRVLQQVVRLGPLDRAAGAGEQPLDVDADQRRRQQARPATAR